MIERHADPLDEAAALSAAMTDGAIAAARMANAPESHPDFDGIHCVDCPTQIPAPRLAMGKVRCVVCQGIIEHRNKLKGRPSASANWDQVDS